MNEPKLEKVYKNDKGNWIASYSLETGTLDEEMENMTIPLKRKESKMKIKRISTDNIMLIVMLIMFFIALFTLYEQRKLSHKIDSISHNVGMEELVRELNEENNQGELK